MADKGPKFTEKYGVRLASSFASDPDNEQLRIPPKGHALYDEDGSEAFDPQRVAEIDADGRCAGTIIVWADPDNDVLWVVEGRGRLLDCQEVNRRRNDRGDKPIEIELTRLPGNLDRAVEHVRLRNFHRKVPTLSHTAREVAALFKLGKNWKRIAEILHLDMIFQRPLEECDEALLRQLVPLAFCVDEVAAVFDARRLPLRQAVKFGGSDPEGAKALGKKKQIELLRAMMEARAAKPAVVRPMGPRRAVVVRDKLREAGEEGYAELVAYMQGDEGALGRLPPKVQEAVRAALEVTLKGPGGKVVA